MFTTLDAGGRTRLLERLYALATDTAGSVVLMTLRADFSGRCGDLRSCVRGCLPVAYRVERFGETEEEAREGLARCQERQRAAPPDPS